MGSALTKIPSSFTRSDLAPRDTTEDCCDEHFDTFKGKIAQLASEIESCSIDDVHQLDGGAYNRVAAARACWRNETTSELWRAYVFFRFPRKPQKDELDQKIQDQVAITDYVRREGIPVPAVFAFDATSANACGSPYAVYELISGHNLEICLRTLSTEDRIHLTNQFVKLLAKFESVEFPVPGRLRRGTAVGALSRWSCFDRDRSMHPWKITLDVFREPSLQTLDTCTTDNSVLSLIRKGLLAWQAQVAKHENEAIEVATTRWYYTRLLRICEHMKQNDHFQEVNQHVFKPILYHWDLEPRNILVRRIEGRWQILSIVDWDDARSSPSILCRRPPAWLWDPTYLDRSWIKPNGFQGDIDAFPPEMYSNIDKNAQIVKKHFETLFIEKVMSIEGRRSAEAYQEEAYGAGKWLRRLYWFAEHGVRHDRDLMRLEDLEADWHIYLSQR